MVLLGPPCKLVRREPLQARVRSVLVEVGTPLTQQLTRMTERVERRHVQERDTSARQPRAAKRHTNRKNCFVMAGSHTQWHGSPKLAAAGCLMRAVPTPRSRSGATGS